MHPRQLEDLAGADEVKQRADEGVDNPVERVSSFLGGRGENVRTGTTSMFQYVSTLRLTWALSLWHRIAARWKGIVHLIQSYLSMR
jgi:hypothetical protein